MLKLKLFFILSLLFLSSCSVHERFSRVDEEGVIPQEVYSAIEVGRTHKDTVVKYFGRPDKSETTKGDREIYTYQHTLKQTKHVRFLFVLAYSWVDENVEFYHIRFKDDIVDRKWIDEKEYTQPFRLEPRQQIAKEEGVPAPVEDTDDSLIEESVLEEIARQQEFEAQQAQQESTESKKKRNANSSDGFAANFEPV